MTTTENLLDTVKANSDQLNACDIPKPITVTIESVDRGSSKEQPVKVRVSGGYQPWYPCKTVRRILIGAWGENGREWVGKSLTLYCDESVKYGGVAVGGIRVSHMSDIASDMTFSVNLTRGKKGQVMVKRLKIDAPAKLAGYPADQFTTNLPAWRSAIAAGKLTAEQVISKAEQKGLLSDEQKAAIREPITEEAAE
jgi:hypothetical protein